MLFDVIPVRMEVHTVMILSIKVGSVIVVMLQLMELKYDVEYVFS